MLLSEWKNEVIKELNISEQDLFDELPELLGMKPYFLDCNHKKNININKITGNPYILYLTAYLACLKFDNDYSVSEKENEEKKNIGEKRKEYVSNILNHYCTADWDNTYLEYTSIISATEYSDNDIRGAFENVTSVILDSIEESFQNNCYVHLSFSLWVRSILYRWYRYEGKSGGKKDCDKKSLAESVYSLFRSEKNNENKDEKQQNENKSGVKTVAPNTVQNWVDDAGIENDFSKNIAYIVQLACLEFDHYMGCLGDKDGKAVIKKSLRRKRLGYAIEKVKQYGCRELYSRNIEHYLLRVAARGVISFKDIEWHSYYKEKNEYIVNISKILKYLISLEREEKVYTKNKSFNDTVIVGAERNFLDCILRRVLEECECNNKLELADKDIGFINIIISSKEIEKKKYKKEGTRKVAAPATSMMNKDDIEAVENIQDMVGYCIKYRENFYISNVFKKRLKSVLVNACENKDMKYPIVYEESDIRTIIRMVLPSYEGSYRKLLNNSISSRNWLLNLCLRLRTTREVINKILEYAQYYGLSDDEKNIEIYYKIDEENEEFIGTVQWYQKIEEKMISEKCDPNRIPMRYPEYYAMGTKEKLMALLIAHHYIEECYGRFKDKILLEHLLDIVYRQHQNGVLFLTPVDFCSESDWKIYLKDGHILNEVVQYNQGEVEKINKKCGERYYKDIYYEEFALFGNYGGEIDKNSQIFKENQDELTKLRLFASYMYLVMTGRYYTGELKHNTYMWLDNGFKNNLNLAREEHELREMLEYLSNIMFLFLEDNADFVDDKNENTSGYYKNGVPASSFNSLGMPYRTVRPDDDSDNYIGGPEYSWEGIKNRIFNMLKKK